ncbi:hypothetical protein BJ742DRAFT_805096 [Cladochytrium replicatum]|nr:hypothetical protein BJ742DRAFT_805096 [Cladochytrium replicatum]
MHWTLPHGDHESFERLHSAVTYPSESKRHQTKQPGATRTSITYSTADMQSDDTLGKMQIFAPASVYAKPLSSHELQIQLREEIARDLARYCSLMCDELPSKCAPQRPSKKHLSSDSFKHASHAELAHSLSGTVRRPPVTASKASGGHSCAVLAHRRMTISQTPIYPQKSNPAILAGSRSMDRKRTF